MVINLAAVLCAHGKQVWMSFLLCGILEILKSSTIGLGEQKRVPEDWRIASVTTERARRRFWETTGQSVSPLFLGK